METQKPDTNCKEKLKRKYLYFTSWLANLLSTALVVLIFLLFILTFGIFIEKYNGSYELSVYLCKAISGPECKEASSFGSDLIALTTAFISLFLTCYAFFQYKQAKKKIRDQYKQVKRQIEEANPIRTYPVNTDEDDIEVMLQYYKGAEEVVVFAGDFSWIKDNPGMYEIVSELLKRNKIKLVSSKTEEEVCRSFSNDMPMFENLKKSMKFNNPERLKCSLVTHPGHEQAFLYKVTSFSESSSHNKAVCVVTPKDEAKALCSMLSLLTKQASS